jgi:thiol-disulfide isomerase/thioredoxin
MAETTSRRRWLMMVGVGGLAAAAGYGVNLWLGDHQPGDSPNAAAVQALLAAPLRDLEGGSKAIDSWRGKVLVVNFWATWCAPCRQEIPEFVKLQERLGSRGLQFVGIAIDKPQPVGDFAREFRINYPLLIAGLDTMELMREAGNKAGVLPFTLILDRQGNVARSHRGPLSEAALEKVVKPLL